MNRWVQLILDIISKKEKKIKKKIKKKKFISLPKKVGKTNKINDRNEKKRPN